MQQSIAAGTIDPAAERWRLDHIATYRSARPWMMAAADLDLDTTALDAVAVAKAVLDRVQVTPE